MGFPSPLNKFWNEDLKIMSNPEIHITMNHIGLVVFYRRIRKIESSKKSSLTELTKSHFIRLYCSCESLEVCRHGVRGKVSGSQGWDSDSGGSYSCLYHVRLRRGLKRRNTLVGTKNAPYDGSVMLQILMLLLKNILRTYMTK